MARILGKWKNTGKYAWHEDTSEYKFRMSPKFKTSKQAENYAKKEGIGWHSYFTVRDKPTSDECKADKLDPYGHYTQKNGGVPSTTQMRNRSEYSFFDSKGEYISDNYKSGQEHWEHLSPAYRKRAEVLDKEQTKFWDGQLERESPDGKISSFEKMKKKDARRKLMAPSNREYRFDIDGKAGEDSLVASYGKGRELTIIKTADGDIMTQEKY